MSAQGKLRVAYVDYGLEPDKPGRSGLSDIVWDMATELVNQGHEAHVIASYTTNDYPDPRVIVHNFPAPPIGYRNIIGQLWILKRAAKIAREGHFDLIHAAEYVSTAVFAKQGLKTPLFFTSPGHIFERVNNINHFDWSATLVYKWAAVVSSKKCAKIIATSNEMKKWWVYSGAKEENITTIPLGVDTSKFAMIEGAKRKLGLDDSSSILFVGRFQRENNLEQLLRAFHLVLVDIPSAKLDIIGFGEQENELHRLAEQLGVSANIRWHGKVPFDMLPYYYSSSDVFALPRLSRVTPRVIFQAMACQTPIVASDVGGISEFIVNGENGYLANPKDDQDLAHRITQLVSDRNLAAVMGYNNRRYAVEHLDWKIIVERIVAEVYDKTLR